MVDEVRQRGQLTSTQRMSSTVERVGCEAARGMGTILLRRQAKTGHYVW